MHCPIVYCTYYVLPELAALDSASFMWASSSGTAGLSDRYPGTSLQAVRITAAGVLGNTVGLSWSILRPALSSSLARSARVLTLGLPVLPIPSRNGRIQHINMKPRHEASGRATSSGHVHLLHQSRLYRPDSSSLGGAYPARLSCR